MEDRHPHQLRLLPSMARINGRLLPRALRTIATLESNHPAAPHYYLPFVGVEPEWQGRGLGTALMRPVLDRCDEEKMPAYLEASSPRNRVLYERHGFQVTEQFSVGPIRRPCGGCGGTRRLSNRDGPARIRAWAASSTSA